MNEGLIYLSIMMVCAASYSAMQKLASQYLSPTVVPVISGITAFIGTAILFLVSRAAGVDQTFSAKGLLFAILVGVFAVGIEFFGVLGYSKGVPLITAYIITGLVSVLAFTVYGILVFKEPITAAKIIALILAAIATTLAGR